MFATAFSDQLTHRVLVPPRPTASESHTVAAGYGNVEEAPFQFGWETPNRVLRWSA